MFYLWPRRWHIFDSQIGASTYTTGMVRRPRITRLRLSKRLHAILAAMLVGLLAVGTVVVPTDALHTTVSPVGSLSPTSEEEGREESVSLLSAPRVARTPSGHAICLPIPGSKHLFRPSSAPIPTNRNRVIVGSLHGPHPRC